MSITLWPGENSGWRKLNEGNTLLNLLSILTNSPLISLYWHLVSVPSENKWQPLDEPVLGSMRDQRMWLEGRVCAQSWDLPLSF